VLQAAAAAGPKESAQERLKRLMQAQLNKAAQKDSLANAQKKIQVCTACKAAPAVQQANAPPWHGVHATRMIEAGTAAQLLEQAGRMRMLVGN
jgi:hypothetical protein